MIARRTLVLVALLIAGQARGANPPNVMDLPPANLIPAPVDMMPAAPRASDPEPPAPARPMQPSAKPSGPSSNPLWAIPLSKLTATRERPIFLPSRRAPSPGVELARLFA